MVEVVIFSVKKKKCEHIANNVEWVVESTTSDHVIPSKELFATYKIKDFDTVKIVHHFPINQKVKIGDMYIKTNASCTMMFKDALHVQFMP